MRSTVSAIWAVAGSALLLASACSSSGSPASSTGGKSGSGGASNSGGSTASGGSVGSGGSASGGAPGAGGSSTGGSSTGGAGTGGAGTGGAGTGGRINTGGTSVTGGAGGGGKGGSGNGGSTNTGGAAGGSNQDAGTMADAVVVHDGAVTGGVYVRTGWTAEYTCTGKCPAQMTSDAVDATTTRAFDGNMGTRWSTGQYQNTIQSSFPLYFTVDMKQVMSVSKITMHPGSQDAYDAPGTMDVFLSVDGVSFGTAVVTAHKPPAAGGTDTISFPQTTARYIQLKGTKTIQQVTASAADRFWAIGEMNVYP